MIKQFMSFSIFIGVVAMFWAGVANAAMPEKKAVDESRVRQADRVAEASSLRKLRFLRRILACPGG